MIAATQFAIAAATTPRGLSTTATTQVERTRPNPEAERVLCRHRNALFAFLRRKGFSAEEADDLTQETLLRAYAHLGAFRGSSMTAWLYRIAANVAVDHLRKQRLTFVAWEAAEGVPCSLSPDDDPMARLDREDRQRGLQAVIALLPECHQRILRLRYFEDRSLAEIAAAMNCSPMAAKLRVFRAVSALRKRWHAAPPEGEWATG
jgi:RNA polymerase sigma-70 factor (ECF subfamily)